MGVFHKDMDDLIGFITTRKFEKAATIAHAHLKAGERGSNDLKSLKTYMDRYHQEISACESAIRSLMYQPSYAAGEYEEALRASNEAKVLLDRLITFLEKLSATFKRE